MSTSDRTAAESSVKSLSTLRSLGRLIPYARPALRPMALSAITAAMATACALVFPLVIGAIIDGPIADGDVRGLIWPGIGLLALGVGEAGLFFVRRIIIARPAMRVEAHLRADLYAKLQRLPVSFHDQWSAGQLLSRAISDLGMIRRFLSFAGVFIIVNVTTFVIGSIILIILDWRLGLIIAALAIPLVAISFPFETRYRVLSRRAQDQSGDLATTVEESVLGIRILKAFGRGPHMSRRFLAQARDLHDMQMAKARVLSVLWAAIVALPEIAVGVTLLLGIREVVAGSMTAGLLVSFFGVAMTLRWPVESIGWLLALANETAAATERFYEVMDAPETLLSPADPVQAGPRQGRLTFSDVRFAFPDAEADGQEVLRGVDLDLAPGQTVALVGATGSGKSAMTMLVNRLHDVTGGAVLLNGVDIRSLDLRDLRSRVSVAFEEPTLLSASVRENILMGLSVAADAREVDIGRAVDRAIRVAQAEFVYDLPWGLDTRIGEQGLSLSGGQRQRLALARAVVGQPEILVLDDPLSALDIHTEAAVERALRSVLADTTALIVAHRASTVLLADRVALLVDGRIAALGTHSELMATVPAYADLLSSADDRDHRGGGAAGDGVVMPEAHGSADVNGSTQDTGAAEGGRSAEVNGSAGTNGAGGVNGSADAGRTPSTAAGEPAAGPETVTETDTETATETTTEADPDLEWRGVAAEDVDEVSTMAGARLARRSRRLLASLLRPHRRRLIRLGLLTVFEQASFMLGPLMVGYGIDSGITGLARGDGWPLTIAVTGYLAAGMVNALTRAMFVRLTATIAQAMLLDVRGRVFDHAQGLSVSFHEGYTSGRVISRMTSDLDNLEDLAEEGLDGLISGILSVVIISVTLVVLDPLLGFIALLSYIPIAWRTVWFQRVSRVIYRRTRRVVASVIVQFTETMNGLRAVLAFRREPRNAAIFGRMNDDYARANGDGYVAIAKYSPSIQLIGNLALTVVMVVGAARVIDGGVLVGTLASFLLYMRRMYDPLEELAMFYNGFQAASAALEKISGLLEEEPSVPEPTAPAPMGDVDGTVEFHGVQFSYTPEVPVLSHLDLTIPAGQTVALVGTTGAGKSTLAKLVARFYDPTVGTVTLDGVDVSRLGMTDLRRGVVMVTQESFLFSGSVADNIALGRPSADRAEIEAAADALGAGEFIRALPDGFDTDVRKRGGRLSAGQRQLVAFARAFLADPAVLILDEATASLDIPSERAVQRALRRVLHGRTAIIIAHRLSTVAIAERVLVMSHGRVIEDGSPAELMASEGTFAGLHSAWRASLV